MTVFIVQKPKPGGVSGTTYDVSPAQEYGELRFIYDSYENPSIRPAESIEKMRKALEDFNSASDYIVWSGGDPYALLLTGFVMSELGLPIKYLRFERLRHRQTDASADAKKAGYYIPVEMPNSAY